MSLPLVVTADRMLLPLYAVVNRVDRLTGLSMPTRATTRLVVAAAVLETLAVPTSALYPAKVRNRPFVERVSAPSDAPVPLRVKAFGPVVGRLIVRTSEPVCVYSSRK